VRYFAQWPVPLPRLLPDPAERIDIDLALYVDAAVADLPGAGVQVVAEPADQSSGERVASVADPDGFVVHIGAASG